MLDRKYAATPESDVPHEEFSACKITIFINDQTDNTFTIIRADREKDVLKQQWSRSAQVMKHLWALCRGNRRILRMGHAHSELLLGKSLIRNSPCINARESSNPINSSNPTHRNVCWSDEYKNRTFGHVVFLRLHCSISGSHSRKGWRYYRRWMEGGRGLPLLTLQQLIYAGFLWRIARGLGRI